MMDRNYRETRSMLNFKNMEWWCPGCDVSSRETEGKVVNNSWYCEKCAPERNPRILLTKRTNALTTDQVKQEMRKLIKVLDDE